MTLLWRDLWLGERVPVQSSAGILPGTVFLFFSNVRVVAKHRFSFNVRNSEKNRYLLTAQDGFTRFASAYPFCKKEAGAVTRVLICEHFSAFGLPNQIHSENGREFVIMDRVIK